VIERALRHSYVLIRQHTSINGSQADTAAVHLCRVAASALIDPQ
jgi:hypothetical protein